MTASPNTAQLGARLPAAHLSLKVNVEIADAGAMKLDMPISAPPIPFALSEENRPVPVFCVSATGLCMCCCCIWSDERGW